MTRGRYVHAEEESASPKSRFGIAGAHAMSKMIQSLPTRPQGSPPRRAIGAAICAAVPLLVLLGYPSDVTAQNQDAGLADGTASTTTSASTAVAGRTDQAPVIDGVPDEAAWQNGPVLSDFVQRVPDDGSPASERTEVRVIYDDDALYVAVWAWDSRADQIVPGDAIRDYEVTDADAILMIFDTYKDEGEALGSF